MNVVGTIAVVPVGIPELIDWRGGMPGGGEGRLEGIGMVVTVGAAEPEAVAVAEPEPDEADAAEEAAEAKIAELEEEAFAAQKAAQEADLAAATAAAEADAAADGGWSAAPAASGPKKKGAREPKAKKGKKGAKQVLSFGEDNEGEGGEEFGNNNAALFD